jgi:hypothetical protein
LSNIKAYLLTFLLILVAIFVSSKAFGADPKVFSGKFEDGAEMKWVCQPGAKGVIPFQFTTPEGGQYRAAVACGEDA